MPVSREIVVPQNDRLNVSRNFNLPHSPGIRAGEFIFLSGMLSTDPVTGERSPGTMAHETRQTLANMQHMLESAGSSLERVVKITVLLYDMLEFENMNAVYRQFFPHGSARPHHVRRAAQRRDEDRDRVRRAGGLSRAGPRPDRQGRGRHRGGRWHRLRARAGAARRGRARRRARRECGGPGGAAQRAAGRSRGSPARVHDRHLRLRRWPARRGQCNCHARWRAHPDQQRRDRPGGDPRGSPDGCRSGSRRSRRTSGGDSSRRTCPAPGT